MEREAPAGKMVQVIPDNHAAHNHPKGRVWRARHPRGVFKSGSNLQSAITQVIAQTNHDPKPFVWTANPDKIIAAGKRGHQMSDSIH